MFSHFRFFLLNSGGRDMPAGWRVDGWVGVGCWGVGWSSGGNPAGAQRGRLPALDHRAFYHFGPRWTSHLPVLARSVLNQTLPILLQRLEERYSKLEFQEIG